MPTLVKPRVRARHLLTGVLAVSLALPVVVVLDAGRAGSAPSECTPGVNCAPTAVNFYAPGTNSYQVGFDGKYSSGFYGSGVRICGIQSQFTPSAAHFLDATYDDTRSYGVTGLGNYRHSESYSFQMPSKTTLAADNTITVSLPRPAVDYRGGGSNLPPRQLPLQGNSVPDFVASATVTATPDPSTPKQKTTVSVTLPGVADSKRVQLKVWDPYAPPAMVPWGGVGGGLSWQNGYDTPSQYALSITALNPDPSVPGDPSVGLTAGNFGLPVAQGAAWTVSTIKPESLVFTVDILTPISSGVGSENPNYRILQAANVDFNDGTPTATKNNSPCKNAVAPPSWLQARSGPTYFVVIDGYAYIADARSAASGGAEFARLTVPGIPKAVGPNKTVYVVVLGAVSPPGQGTKDQPPPGSATPYPASSFSISTSAAPLKGYPATPPVFYSLGFPDRLTSRLAIDGAAQTVDAEANNSATVLLRDQFNNPVPNTDVDLLPTSARSTYNTVTDPAVSITPGKSGAATYARTGLDGTATFDLGNSCAQTVRFSAMDVTNGIGPIGVPKVRSDGTIDPTPQEVVTTWTAGPAVAPDGYTPDFDGDVGVFRPGLLSASMGSTAVTGSGTTFTALTVGHKIQRTDGTDIGTIASITDDTHLTLTANASATVSNLQYEEVLVNGAPNCGVPLVRSSMTVASSDGKVFSPDNVVYVNNPSDGVSPAIVTVTMGDEFGNPVACKPVELAPTESIDGLTITPLTPPLMARVDIPQPDGTVVSVKRSCPGGETAGFTNAAGLAKFAVTSNRQQPVELHVIGMDPVSLWPWGQDHTRDSARIYFTGPSWTASSFVLAKQTALASGVVSNELTVTLKTSDGLPLAGQDVAVTACKGVAPVDAGCTPSATSVVQPSVPGVTTTDAQGVVKFGVGDSVAETVSYRITDLTQPIWYVSGTGNPTTASVTFTNSGFSFTAAPAELVGDGVGTTTLILNGKDLNGGPAPILGVPTLVTPAGVTWGVTAGPNPFKYSLKGVTTGPVQITANVIHATGPAMPCWGIPISPVSCLVTLTTTVLFRPPPHQFVLSATPTSVPADGATASIVTVNALLADGTPATNVPVQLSALSGAPSIYPSLATTNALGQAFFSVSNDKVQKVKFTAKYLQIGKTTGSQTATGCTAAGTCQVSIDFSPTEASNSTVTIDKSTISRLSNPPPGACSPAALSCAAVTVTLLDASNKPINGNAVALSTGSSTTVVRASADNPGALSGKEAPGQVTFYISDWKPEVLTIRARDLNTGVILTQSVTLTVT